MDDTEIRPYYTAREQLHVVDHLLVFICITMIVVLIHYYRQVQKEKKLYRKAEVPVDTLV